MGQKNLARGVKESRPATTTSAPEKTRILMQHGRKNRLGHVIANHEIAICGSEVTRIPRHALPEGRVGIR